MTPAPVIEGMPKISNVRFTRLAPGPQRVELMYDVYQEYKYDRRRHQQRLVQVIPTARRKSLRGGFKARDD